MASRTEDEILYDFAPKIRIYKDGRVERLTNLVPASVDTQTGVRSKDVAIAPEINVSARLFIPQNVNPDHKLPLLIYFHGGGFCIESAYCSIYHNYLNLLVAEANVVVVSVDYRLAPEHPLPTAYDDSWVAIKWVASHAVGGGNEVWLKNYVDFERVFFGGDSAGANITHHMALRVGSENLDGVNLIGILLIHPYFLGEDPIGGELADTTKRAFYGNSWQLVCPWTTGLDDPLINVVLDPKFSSLECKRVLILVAEKDWLRDRGWQYYEKLSENGWGGKLEIMEAKGEDHVFHLSNPSSESAVVQLKKAAFFLKQDKKA